LPLDLSNWNQNIEVLGVPYGDSEWELSFWKQICRNIQDDLRLYNQVGATLDAKSILTKSMVLSKVSYIASAKPIPREVCKIIEDALLKFVVPHRKTFLKICDFALPRSMGGYSIDDVVLHASLFLLRDVFSYVKKKLNGESLSDQESYVEYNIGWQLSKYIGVPLNILCPHRSKPNTVYQCMMNIITSHKIPVELLYKGKFKNIYCYIIEKNFMPSVYPKYLRLHHKVLPNYLKSFNFQVHYRLLPVKRLFIEYALDTDSQCAFCKFYPDTHSHIFSQCNELKFLWRFLDEVLLIMKISPSVYNFTDSRRKYDYDFVNTRIPSNIETIIIYMNSVVNLKIWSYRKKILTDNIPFNIKDLIRNLVQSFHARKNMEPQLKSCSQIQNISDLCSSAVQAKINISLLLDTAIS